MKWELPWLRGCLVMLDHPDPSTQSFGHELIAILSKNARLCQHFFQLPEFVNRLAATISLREEHRKVSG